MIARPRLDDILGTARPATAVVAPPGYGKTAAVAQWASRQPPGTVAWLSVDLLDSEPLPFWVHLLHAVSAVTDTVDDEPLLLLRERGAADPLFLAALCEQVGRASEPATLVIDDLDRVVDAKILDGLAFVVERTAPVLRLIVTGRTDPALPLGRWRTAGTLADLRQADLRFDDNEARQFVGSYGDVDLDAADVTALLQRADGWPAGLQLAMLIVTSHDSPSDGVRAVTGSNRILSDYLVAEVLDRLPPDERAVALALSVFAWFDAELCTDVVGAESVPVARRLHERGLFLTQLDDRPGTYRFHALFRELLETEQRWRDPARWHALHRNAADVFASRGDLNTAYRHLLAIGDVDTACDLVLAPILTLLDQGGHAELPRMLDALPVGVAVSGPDRMLALAAACLQSGNLDMARHWAARTEPLVAPGDAPRRARRGTVPLLAPGADAHGDAATRELQRTEAYLAESATRAPFEQRFAVNAARVAIPMQLPDADRWVAECRQLTSIEQVRRIAAPALEAWLHLTRGDLRRGRTCAQEALHGIDLLRNRPTHGSFDAFVAAGWSALGDGDLSTALHHVDQARNDAMTLAMPWCHVRAGALAAETIRLMRGGPESLALVLGLQAQLDAVDLGPYLYQQIVAAQIAALVASGDAAAARALADQLADTPFRRVLEARIALQLDQLDVVADLLRDRQAWPAHLLIEATVLSALALTGRRADERMTEALQRGNDTEWVSPFMGYGRAMRRTLDRLPVSELHPRLHRVISSVAAARSAADSSPVEPLTERERTLLNLLPTHLSYAQMGEELHLSVNTVKTYLKAVYRKLDVASRADAVDAAHRAGLVRSHSLGAADL
jgi:LuxR family maltose regulon positive regulatory protein